MPGGHDDAERRSVREWGEKEKIGAERECGEKEESGAERRSLAQTAGRVRKLVSSGVQERGAVERRRRERDVVWGQHGAARSSS